jgi:hypothetical protein
MLISSISLIPVISTGQTLNIDSCGIDSKSEMNKHEIFYTNPVFLNVQLALRQTGIYAFPYLFTNGY